MEQIRRSLTTHAPLRRSPHHVLRKLLEHLPEDATTTSPVIELENRIKTLLGKEDALFFPSGTMAQPVALRVHAENRGRHAFAAHPQTHLAVWEKQAYSVVHGLRMHALGDYNTVFGLHDLEQVGEPLAAVLTELPQRDLGGLLPTWDDLVQQTRWTTEHGAAAHMDGARLWEAQTAYDKPHAEIAGLFDSVYVSLYKSLEGVRGAVLAGTAEFIAQARVWRQRMGGGIPDAWPLAAIALVGLDETLPRMAEFREHAQALARAINADTPAHTVPEVPLTPLFHVHLPIAPRELEARAAELIRTHGIQLFYRARTNPDPQRSSFEITVGVNALDFTPGEVAAIVRGLVL